MGLFSGTFYFLVLVGILIFIHEGGHFLVAKLFRVKVMVFSIGMGPRLFGFKKGETDYRISAVPMGGYVRMLGEDPTEDLSEDERERSMQGVAPWKRILVYSAGPAMNLVFPLFLYFFLAMGQTMLPPAQVGVVIEGSPAAEAGLMTGDEISAIDGDPVYSFNHMVDLIQDLPGKKITLTVIRNGRSVRVPVTPAAKEGPKYQIPMLRHLRGVKGQIGIIGIYPNTIVGVENGGLASGAGLKTFDRIRKVDGILVKRLFDLERLLLERKGRVVTLEVNRLKDSLPKELFPTAKEAMGLDIEAQPSAFEKAITEVRLPVPDSISGLVDLGVHSSMGYILDTRPDGPAAKVGLSAGDRLIAVDGVEANIYDIVSRIHKVNPEGTDTLAHVIAWTRGGKVMSAKYKADYISAGAKKDLGVEDDVIDMGFHVRPYSKEWVGEVPEMIVNPAPVAYSMHMAWTQTIFWSRVILDVLGSVVTGNVSPKSFSGPIGIATATAQVSEEGPSAFFGFMGFISLNLGLLNLLLPIPILDGGRLLLIVTEVVMRKRLSQAIQEKILVTGAVMILLLLVWAVVMDITRIFVG